MSSNVKAVWSAVALLAAVLVMGVANLAATYLEVHQANSARDRAAAVTEHKICTTLDALAQDKPPAGNPATNPSRGYLQDLHAQFIALAVDLGCQGR